MKKLIIALMGMCAIACGTHSEEGHSHDTHDHSAHSHETHSHDAHDHSAHSHETHSHDTHDHSAHSHETHSHDTHDEHEHADGEITFTAHDASLGSFATEKVKTGDFFPIIKTAGRIISTPQGETVVTAPISGTVSFGKNTNDGHAVQAASQVMFINPDNTSGASAAQIKADYDLASSRMRRADSLIADRIISQSHYNDIKAEYEKARAAYSALNSSHADEMAVRSPFSGYIRNISVTNGSYVEKGTALFSVVKNSRGRMEADVPQKHYDDLPNVVSAVFVTSAGKKYDTAALNGSVVSYSKSVSPAGMLTIIMEYDSAGDIPYGSYADVYLRLGRPSSVISVPVGALTEEQGEYFVYVQTCSESYRKQPVTIGSSDGMRMEIKRGLSSGDVVVTEGTYRVKLAGNTGAIPHSHEH